MAGPLTAPDAVSSAREGLARANARLDRGAATIASSGVGRTGAGPTEGGAGSSGDLPAAILDLSLAAHEASASAAVLRASEELGDELLALGRRDR